MSNPTPSPKPDHSRKTESGSGLHAPACSPSDTPETDAIAAQYRENPIECYARMVIWEFAERMEQERNEYRQLADAALETLQITRKKYGIGDRHVMREMKNRIESLEKGIRNLRDTKGRYHTEIAARQLFDLLENEQADTRRQ